MNKNFKRLMLAFLCLGLLLIGVGAGVAFVEYSELEYAGQRVLGEEERSQSIEIRLPEGDCPVIVNSYLDSLNYVLESAEVVSDRSLQPDMMKIDIRFIGDDSMPAWWTEDTGGAFYVNLHFNVASDVEAFMTLKDMVLEDIKEGRFGDYVSYKPLEVQISIHPNALNRIQAH